ncbi:hypothetical protein DOTSEDRAFT_28884 [Dothistroma septosporum NZE10]|uniref:Uncharacterized protein n=1 Tax=Dothistroma septosporum (strain NZE10 / CBS 128990) TaxID=675120 RepID=M2YIB5_DOTSN|nr:hypothetical protein DOTSEDRAFT_28884 [Dothistroma septosporum NZE10]
MKAILYQRIRSPSIELETLYLTSEVLKEAVPQKQKSISIQDSLPPDHLQHFSIQSITTIAGRPPDQQYFTLSAELVRQRSGYFRCMIGKFKSLGMTASVLLPDIWTKLFGAYGEWCTQLWCSREWKNEI